MQLLKWIKSLLENRSYQDSVEYYVASKHPTTTAEVEYWIREYDQHRKAWSLWKSLYRQFGIFSKNGDNIDMNNVKNVSTVGTNKEKPGAEIAAWGIVAMIFYPAFIDKWLLHAF